MTPVNPERWFEVWGADDGDEFVAILRREAENWPAADDLTPLHTGGWQRDGFIITYVDMSDPTAGAVVASFRADFDGQRVLAATVSPEHIDQAGYFEDDKPLGEPPLEIAAGNAAQCAHATAAWFRERLFDR